MKYTIFAKFVQTCAPMNTHIMCWEIATNDFEAFCSFHSKFGSGRCTSQMVFVSHWSALLLIWTTINVLLLRGDRYNEGYKSMILEKGRFLGNPEMTARTL